MNDTGVKFEITGEYGRDRVRGYHGSPEPKFLTKAKKVDLKGIKTGNITETGLDEIESRFMIGFEIEKTSFHRGAVTEYPLFKGFETDSSCGVEAVTHVLPLLPKSIWRTKVFNMFVEAKKIISDEYSPSNRNCGGHITLSVQGMSGEEVAQRVRKNFGIFYAIFRKRLINSYCNRNLSIKPQGLSFRDYLGGEHNKYCPIKIMSHGIELRLPSRVQSVKQMMRRYELCYHLLDFSINNPNGTYKKFLKIVRPVLMSMYEGNAEKVEALEELSQHFRRMILTGKLNRVTIPYVEGWSMRRSQLNPEQIRFHASRELFYSNSNSYSNWFDSDLRRHYGEMTSEWVRIHSRTNAPVFLP